MSAMVAMSSRKVRKVRDLDSCVSPVVLVR
jgi:hypothetical protein